MLSNHAWPKTAPSNAVRGRHLRGLMTAPVARSRRHARLWRGGAIYLLTSLVGLWAATTGCARPQASKDPPLAPGSVAIKGAGSTFAAPLLHAWSTAYRATHPDVTITYDAVGSGEGVRRFIGDDLAPGDRVDFGASDSAMSDAELAQTDGTLMLPVTGACVVLAYHVSPLRSELRLSRKAYAGIFLGRVTRWNDPLIHASNPGLALPDQPIGLAVRLDSSGTTFAFSQHLGAISDEWRAQFPPSTTVPWPGDAMRAKGNDGVAGLIKSFNGMIGYLGYEFAQKLDLDVAALENKRGQFVTPSPAACAAGLATAQMPSNLRAFTPDPDASGAYPIVTFSWVLLRQHSSDPAQQTALRTFFRWCLESGQSMAASLGYVPLPSPVADKALRALGIE